MSEEKKSIEFTNRHGCPTEREVVEVMGKAILEIEKAMEKEERFYSIVETTLYAVIAISFGVLFGFTLAEVMEWITSP